MEYKHTQIARTILFVLAAVLLVDLVAVSFIDSAEIQEVGPLIGWLSAGIFLLIGLLFGSLTVRVTQTHLSIAFGVGIIRKTWKFSDIVSARTVENSWWYGFGIRLTPHGWLYNVSGLDAVEIQLSNKKNVRVGTDEPDALLEAIQYALKH